jgi:putative Mg2+ transporter-C (MgtC) family protein
MTLEWSDILLRLGAATAAGVAIGINRDIRDKPIGARTLGLVGLGTSTVVVSTIQFPGIAENPDAASRVVQGIIQGLMAGISFIGAGVILRDPRAGQVEGLTTAATVWVTAALGIACGLAEWSVAGIAIAISVFVLVILAWIERALPVKDNSKNAKQKAERD